MTNPEKPSLRKIRTMTSEKGGLSVIEAGLDVPFEIKRTYYLHGIPDAEVRGAHAHKELRQFIVPVAGSFTVELDDGTETFRFHLDNREEGLLVPPGYWRDLSEFSQDAVCFVLASLPYSESDYIREYSQFLDWTTSTNRSSHD